MHTNTRIQGEIRSRSYAARGRYETARARKAGAAQARGATQTGRATHPTRATQLDLRSRSYADSESYAAGQLSFGHVTNWYTSSPGADDGAAADGAAAGADGDASSGVSAEFSSSCRCQAPTRYTGRLLWKGGGLPGWALLWPVERKSLLFA